LFICGGAFAGLEKSVSARLEKGGMGFNAPLKRRDKEATAAMLMQNLEPEDLVRYGLIPEFVGRLPILALLEELDEEALISILTDPKNALVKQYQKLFALEGVTLEFRTEALRAIAKRHWPARPGHVVCVPFLSRFCWIRCTNCPL
ncbi:ATP-dependent Clp protease, ATP-binding subunit ClpX, partial [Acidithiobacillus sp. GGI-221]